MTLYNTAMGAIRPRYRLPQRTDPRSSTQVSPSPFCATSTFQPCFWNVANRPMASPRRFPFFGSHCGDSFSRLLLFPSSANCTSAGVPCQTTSEHTVLTHATHGVGFVLDHHRELAHRVERSLRCLHSTFQSVLIEP